MTDHRDASHCVCGALLGLLSGVILAGAMASGAHAQRRLNDPIRTPGRDDLFGAGEADAFAALSAVAGPPAR